MCFSKEISILTYIIGTTGCLLLFYKKYNDKEKYYIIIGIFLLSVIQMQLIEYYFWSNPDCNYNNKLFTKIGTIINHLEPIILYIALNYYIKLPIYLHIYMLYYIIITIDCTNSVLNNSCSQVTITSNPHIYWPWNYNIYYNYFYILFIITVSLLLYYITDNIKYKILFILTNIITYLISYILYDKKKVVGSIWCFIAAFLPYLLLFDVHKIFN